MMEMRVFIERNIILAIQHLVPLKCFDQRDKTLVCESSTEQDRWIICRLLSFWPRNLPVSFRPSTQTLQRCDDRKLWFGFIVNYAAAQSLQSSIMARLRSSRSVR
jgi:hypothetical protein